MMVSDRSPVQGPCHSHAVACRSTATRGQHMYLSINFFILPSWRFVGTEWKNVKLLLLRYIARTRLAGCTGMAQSMPYVPVINVSVTNTMGRGEQNDAPEVPVVEWARGRRARWAGGRDGGGSGR